MKSMNQLITDFRDEYMSPGIDEKDIKENPLQLFEKWMEEAIRSNLNLPNAMHLATADPDNRPSGRVLLLRDFDENGFVFYSNYDSRKGEELKKNNYASMTFFWDTLYRQVRIEGIVGKVTETESDAYFQSRPRESQISAVVSEQSRVLENRESLEMRFKEFEEKFLERAVPRPANWGGYRLFPSAFEFWQGREHRLHDRIQYKKEGNNSWIIRRLFP
jgi:pyridoxamine 5'-phosphate oxidase